MKNKIQNKHFFIKSGTKIYCGKCGKLQLGDNYNMIKHAKECNFSVSNPPLLFNDGENFAYSFKISEDKNKLLFYGFTYNLTLRPGFQDKYLGGKWKNVFSASFELGSKEVREKGLYNIDTWLKKMIDNDHIPSLSTDRDEEIFKSFFPNVPAFSSYGAFLDIYRNKGYGNNKVISDDKANEFLNLGVNAKDFNLLAWDKEQLKKPVNMLNDGIKQSDLVLVDKIFINGEMVTVEGYRMLRLTIECNTGKPLPSFGDKSTALLAEFLIMDGYAYSPNPNCNTILSRILYYGNYNTFLIPKDVIEEFDGLYPSFMLKNYIKSGGKNLCIPLFAGNYDKCMELLYKAGIPLFAERLKQIKQNNELILYKNNIKEIFGIPVKTLKRIVSYDIIKEKNIFTRLSEVFRYNPKFLSLENYSESMIAFLKNQNICHSDLFQSNVHTIQGVNGWTDDEMFITLKYLSRINANWNTYKDYLNFCQTLGEWVFGKWPKNLEEAHDIVAEMVWAKIEKDRDLMFKNAIQDESYQQLSTIYGTDEEKEVFKNSKYIILCPEKAYDLIVESAKMHNCVKGYIDKVCNRKTKIYFLRETEKKNLPFCTVEVTAENVVVQVKEAYNQKPSSDIKEFIKYWAKIKKLQIDTYDLS